MVSYKPLGDEFLGKLCQTKSLECFMAKYWLSPAGELFEINCHDAFDMKINEEPLKEGENFKFPFFHWIPNGNHGWVSPILTTVELIIYPGQWKGGWETWPEAKLHLLYGKVISFSFTHKGDRKWQQKELQYSMANQLIQNTNPNSLVDLWASNNTVPSSIQYLKN